MRKMVLCFLLGLLASYCFAQKQKVSVIELQNGSVLRGYILESEEGTVKLQTADKSVYVYPKADVKEIKETNQKSLGLNERGPQKGKYRGFVDIGAKPFWFNFLASMETSHGFQLLDKLYLGGGTGVSVNPFYVMGNRTFYVPVFADVRVDFINHSVTPFFDCRTGYKYYISNKDGCIYINPSVGCRVMAGKMPLNFSFGADFNGQVSRGFWLNMSFTVGIEF